RGAAQRLHIEGVEATSPGSQLVDVPCIDFVAACKPAIRASQVVDEKVDNVGARGGLPWLCCDVARARHGQYANYAQLKPANHIRLTKILVVYRRPPCSAPYRPAHCALSHTRGPHAAFNHPAET